MNTMSNPLHHLMLRGDIFRGGPKGLRYHLGTECMENKYVKLTICPFHLLLSDVINIKSIIRSANFVHSSDRLQRLRYDSVTYPSDSSSDRELLRDSKVAVTQKPQMGLVASPSILEECYKEYTSYFAASRL